MTKNFLYRAIDGNAMALGTVEAASKKSALLMARAKWGWAVIYVEKVQSLTAKPIKGGVKLTFGRPVK